MSVTVSNEVGSATSGTAALVVNSDPPTVPNLVSIPPGPSMDAVSIGSEYDFYFYVKNIGASGSIAVTVTSDSYGNIHKETEQFTVQSNTSYVLISDVPVETVKDTLIPVSDGTVSATFPGTPGIPATYPLIDLYPVPIGFMAQLGMPSSILVQMTEITAQPANQTVAVGGNATFTVAATGDPAMPYQWQVSTDGGSTWNNVSNSGNYGGATTATLTVSNASIAMTGYQFQCVVGEVPANATSAPATLMVSSTLVAPTITTQPSDATVTAPAKATFSVAASGSPSSFTYTWQRQAAGNTTWTALTNSGSYAGVGTATLTIDPTSGTMNGDEFRCVVSNGVSPDAVSNAATLTVNRMPATVTLGSLSATYDGTAHAATATTVPPGLAVNFTYNGGGTAPTNAGSYSVVGAISDVNYQGIATGTLVIGKATPVVTWSAPAAIAYGTALSSTQLNATASVPGTFVYSPAAGTVPAVGSQTLSVTFTPADATNYTVRSATQTLTVTGLSDQAFLQQLYQDVLGRPIDSGASAGFGAALAGGESRAAVLGDLLGSAEYGAWQIEPVIRLYQAAFARMPDYAGLRNWSNALHADALTLTGAADQFAGSAEFLLKYGSLDNTGYVQQLYRNVLGREADPAGLADWVNQLNGGATRGTILVGFSESPEFQADMANQVEIVRLYDLLLQRMPTDVEFQSWLGFLQGFDQTDTLFAQGYPAGLADADYVSLVFPGFLRRPADAGALNTFGSALTAGTVTHASLVNTLLSSAEFSQFVGPVSRLYMAAFRRVPDAGGLDNWVAYVRAGNPLQSAADQFVASPEFQLTYGSLNDTQYVTLLYENVLGREPDPSGLQDWVNQLGAGSTRGQVLTGFSESPEGIALFAPTVRTFLHYFTFLNTTPAQSDLDYWKNYLATLDDQMREDIFADPAFTNGG